MTSAGGFSRHRLAAGAVTAGKIAITAVTTERISLGAVSCATVTAAAARFGRLDPSEPGGVVWYGEEEA